MKLQIILTRVTKSIRVDEEKIFVMYEENVYKTAFENIYIVKILNTLIFDDASEWERAFYRKNDTTRESDEILESAASAKLADFT